MKIVDIQIVHPDTGKPVSVEEWKKEQDPTRAEWVLITTDELKPFQLHKNLAAEGRRFDFTEALMAGNTLTRAQGLALYEARYTAKLNDILLLIAGDEVLGWIWTCEEDSDPQYSATYAWLVYLTGGDVANLTKTYGFQVRLVSAFES